MRPYPTWRSFRADARLQAFAIAACALLGLLLILVPPTLTEPLRLSDGSVAEGGPEVGRMFRAFARNGTRLVLGTSETGNPMGAESYFELMDADLNSQGRGRIVTYGGAGRSPLVWFPHMAVHGESMRGLRVFYYVNPVYWSPSLNTFNEAYFTRYVSGRLAAAARSGIRDAGVDDVIPHESLRKRTRRHERFLHRLSLPFAMLEAPFVYDVRAVTAPYSSALLGLSTPPARPKDWALSNEAALNVSIDTMTGVAESYLNRKITMVKNVKWGGFKTRELDAFLDFAQTLGVEVCLIIGPYNRTLADVEDPRLKETFEAWYRDVKAYIASRGVGSVDAFAMSADPRSHVDAMHIGKVGARGVYEAWKNSGC